MTKQMTKKQLDALRVTLAQYGLDVKKLVKPRVFHSDLEARIAEIRKLTFKAQSAFWKTAQIRNLTTRMKIDAFHAANPGYWERA